MKRFIRVCMIGIFVVLSLFIGIYVFLVYPDDSRLDALSLEKLTPFQSFYQPTGSLLSLGMIHRLDISDESFVSHKRELFRSLPQAAQSESPRFQSPYQVYVPVGTYPTRLQAMDALFIPGGARLRIKPQLAGRHQIRFAAFAAADDVELGVELDGKNLSSVSLPAREMPAEEPQSWFARQWRKAGSYWTVERRAEVARWLDHRVDIEPDSQSELVFRCADEALGCIISDVSFLRAGEQSSSELRNNVLVILVDTMRRDALAAGNAPALSELGKESTVFEQAIAPGNMTSPSTNALLSCRRPVDLGPVAFAYMVDLEQRSKFYQERRASFPQVFTDNAYATAMIGNVSVLSEVYGVGVHHGFQEQIAIEMEAYDTPQIAAEAVTWLEREGDRPFFLYVHMNGPHAPYRAPWQDVRATYPGKAGFQSYPDVLRWLYQSEIHYTDRYLAKIFSALRKLGLWERTTIAVSADHGDHHTAHRFLHNTVGPNFEGSYFDHGATLLNDEIGVPLIVKPPGAPRPQVYTNYMSTLALGPTVLELSGLEVPAHCQASSLAAVIQEGELTAGGGLLERSAPDVIGSEGFRGRAVIFEGRYKYIRSYEPTDKRVYPSGGFSGAKQLYLVPEELYDLKADPGEERNLVYRPSVSSGDLLNKARALYHEYYNIGDAHELVVDVSGQEEFIVRFPAGVDVETDHPDLLSVESSDGSRLFRAAGHGPTRAIFLIRQLSGHLPEVSIGGEKVGLRATSLRLPLPRLHPRSLPAEAGGPFTLLPQKDGSVAYLRRITDDGQRSRRIVTGNAEFERILRQWGYLNDQ